MYRFITRNGFNAVKTTYKSTFRYKSNCVLKEGDIVHNYEVIKISSVPDLFLSAIELRHSKTNSSHLHLTRNDNNNVFNVSFRTTPMDDTGVAHILEHVVLCGSEKFPVRDPFFKMLDRSMATFMNAMTGSDYTMYPFATQNRVDFNNLLSVYLDAVFFPEIRKENFLQEGWRLEHQDVNNSKTPVILKGVVFNEMKGVMADQEYLFGTNLQRKILPDHTYGVCSGGDPYSIPSLTWKALKEFHSTHYHPSNARFITYGNFNLEDHLSLIDEQVMQKFSPITPDTDVPSQPRWSEPRSHEITCCPDDMAANPLKQSSIAVSFLLSDVSDVFETFVLAILCNLLADGSNSPFYKALINSGLGSSYAPATGFHNHQKESIFSIGLQGVDEKDTDKIREIIDSTFDSVIRDGFSEDRIEGVLHQVELQQKHQSSQFGLHLSFNMLPLWQHGSDPVHMMEINKNISRFRKEMAKDPEFLQNYCQKYFKANNHKMTLTMNPDKEYKEKIERQENDLLQTKLGELNHIEISDLFNQGQILLKEQNKEEDITCLPTLSVDDIPRKQEEEKMGKITIFGSDTKAVSYEEPTNGVTYFTLVRTINELPADLKPYMPLFCQVLTQMGTHDTDHETFSQLEDLYTGGLQASVNISPCPRDSNSIEASVILQSHCLDKNMEKMFELWNELLSKPNFNNKERFQTLIRQQAQGLANSVPFNGHVYAMRNASSGLSHSASQSEIWEGLSQVKLLRSIAEQENVEIILSKMKAIADYVLSSKPQLSEKIRCSIHSTPDALLEAESHVQTFLSKSFVQEETSKSSDHSITNMMKLQAVELCGSSHVLHELPLPVNFAAMSLPTTALYSHADNPALRVLARVMTAKYLLREIREKGGAYGAGARHGVDGVFQFYSYRDPQSIETVDTFHSAIKWICAGNFTEQDINEAKLSIFQKVDAPVSPCNRGNLNFINGIPNEMRQIHRQRLLDITKKDIISVAQKYLFTKHHRVAILGPKNTEVETHENWNIASAD